MTDKKICPLMSRPVYHPLEKQVEMHYVDCEKDKCEFWILYFEPAKDGSTGRCNLALLDLEVNI